MDSCHNYIYILRTMFRYQNKVSRLLKQFEQLNGLFTNVWKYVWKENINNTNIPTSQNSN